MSFMKQLEYDQNEINKVNFCQFSVLSPEEIEKRIRDLRKQMESAAKALDFIEAARLRDEITLLKEKI